MKTSRRDFFKSGLPLATSVSAMKIANDSLLAGTVVTELQSFSHAGKAKRKAFLDFNLEDKKQRKLGPANAVEVRARLKKLHDKQTMPFPTRIKNFGMISIGSIPVLSVLNAHILTSENGAFQAAKKSNMASVTNAMPGATENLNYTYSPTATTKATEKAVAKYTRGRFMRALAMLGATAAVGYPLSHGLAFKAIKAKDRLMPHDSSDVTLRRLDPRQILNPIEREKLILEDTEFRSEALTRALFTLGTEGTFSAYLKSELEVNELYELAKLSMEYPEQILIINDEEKGVSAIVDPELIKYFRSIAKAHDSEMVENQDDFEQAKLAMSIFKHFNVNTDLYKVYDMKNLAQLALNHPESIAIFHDKNKGYVVMVQEDFLKTLHETLDEEDHDSKASDYADKALAILHAFNAIPYNAELAKELKKAQA